MDRPRHWKVSPAQAAPDIAPTSAVPDRQPGPATGSEASDPADRVTTSPADPKTLKQLKPDDVVYVVYETTKDGTKFTYPAKILEIRKDAPFTYFFVHYLGWSQRHDEWIMAQVIHSVVNLSQLPDGLRSLKRRMVPASSGPAYLAAYRRLRPCSVDLSANNICFFSALRKERFHVADRRIMALREARRSGRQDGWSAGAVL
ncbi:uncharacterized protein LOC119108866 [Pollicipes pollicipes]|uniref:uncharacterized protein LOC119108866 n=1 Tax=Pollicipes pollicipes TaxID=41117 RepID=UPI001885650C|nr:uncharacterized protein LOC119108866 [Pollicipes pollicipes]